jgi:esterase/lipase superfamily enzyme
LTGKEPAALYKIDKLVLLSPDVDVDIAGQEISSYLCDPDLVTIWPQGRLPRILKGRLTIYASSEDRALAVSKILFRSSRRLGQLRPEDVPEQSQRHFETGGRVDLISYEGKRTDLFGHSYFNTNPQVSSDLVETRKETGEEYAALRGFFRQYELHYVVADERDVILSAVGRPLNRC